MPMVRRPDFLPDLPSWSRKALFALALSGICLAFTCSRVFRSVDGRALELARALRKRMSAPSEQTARMAPVPAMAAK